MTSTAKAATVANLDGETVASRYETHEVLGRGGMACVYRAIDRTSGRPVALKHLVVPASAGERASVEALFEREFHTLAQLRHPHVVAVHDYGVHHDGSPFYTMDLLDGGDLRERAPIDWRTSCRWVFGICSALALLHSRRLLHRDISPRNIRCTPDGDAKLIDFGAMAPMSAGGTEVVGTPAFTAPETLQRLALDARTDLYSLGVTLYYALTARLPYAARTFGDLLAAWAGKPLPPSSFVPDIPPALDDLVLAMISVEPSLRPPSAFDVMAQLSACAGLRAEESEEVLRAYLSTPTLVGRDAILARLRGLMREARLRRVTGAILEGPAGSGRSRLLDACALSAQTQGFTVLRATATGTGEAFGIARALVDHLLDTLPLGSAAVDFPDLFAIPPAAPANDTTPSTPPQVRPILRNLADPAADAVQLQKAIRRLWLRVSRTHPLLIAVDDAHRIDPPSAGLLAELIDRTNRGGLLLVLTADSEQPGGAALEALTRRCTVLPLAPLSREDTRALFGSLFGDVPNLEMLVGEIDRVARGNPRQCLELAQHLIDRRLVRYAGGHWTLPPALTADDLPRSAAEAMRTRLARLSPHARELAEAHALSFYEAVSDDDYRSLLPQAGSQATELAIAELLATQAIVRDGSVYLLANRVWSAALLAELDPDRTVARHRALAAMYLTKGSFAFIHHAFLAGMDREALLGLDRRNDVHQVESDYMRLVDQNVGKLMWCYPRAIETARALGRSPRDVHDLRRWQFIGTIVSEAPPDLESARRWFEQLVHDSGLDLYRADAESANPADRLHRALTAAYQRYLATPEPERVYPVDEAIRKLGEYAVISLGISGRSLSRELLEGLPEVIEPFVPLSPLLEIIWNNACASRSAHFDCHYEVARERWRAALAKLEGLPETEAHFANAMGNAIAFAIGMMEAQMGLPTAADWAERLDRDRFQRVSAVNLRKLVRLEQGDAEGADKLRRHAEVLALQLRTPQLFHSLLSLELSAYAKSRNLAGVAEVVEQLRPLAARYPGWAVVLGYGEATFDQLRGDEEGARTKFEACIEQTRPDAHGTSVNLGMWLAAHAGLAESSLALGRDEEARATAAHALALCEAREIVAASFDLSRALALAEAKLGVAGAAERLDALIARQQALGATGLRLGLSYEARARVAIWSGDQAGFERFAELTAREYRHGARTPLAARYERLMNEAARAGLRAKLTLADFEALTGVDSTSLRGDELMTFITRSMAGHRSEEERAKLAIQMICAAQGTSAGHLFLMTNAGPVLRASQGAGTPAIELAERVARFVGEKEERAGEMDDMVTGGLESDDVLTSLVQTHTGSYELLPLTCVVEAASVLVGVAAVQVIESHLRNQKQGQLLHALAASLLESGDSQGVRLGTTE